MSHSTSTLRGFFRMSAACLRTGGKMAAWQYVALCAIVLGVTVRAQETTLAATTLATNPNSAFVYMPSASVEGQIAVKPSSHLY